MPVNRENEEWEVLSHSSDLHEESLRHYLRTIHLLPLISPERVIELAQRIEVGDQIARKELILANLRLVISIAKRYLGSDVPLLELIQAGNIGLIQAVMRYDWRRGNRFSTHAFWWIRLAVSRAVKNKNREIHISEHTLNKLSKMHRHHQRLLITLGREPSNQELADACEFSMSQLTNLLSLPREPLSLEFKRSDEGSLDDTLREILADPDEEFEEVVVNRISIQHEISIALGQLTPRERAVLTLRFGLDGHLPHQLKQAGRKLGISGERVRQIEKESLMKLEQVPDLQALCR